MNYESKINLDSNTLLLEQVIGFDSLELAGLVAHLENLTNYDPFEEGFLNSLQLENLQDYFLQNKLLALNEKHSLINFDYESFYKELNTLKNKQYNGFLYISTTHIILFLLKLNLDYSVEVILETNTLI